MTKLLLVFVGGGLGSATRFGTSLLAARWWGTSFPWGTLAVNLAGCFLIGVLFGLSERGSLSPEGRLFLMTGFLGGLTTFSSYGLETSHLTRSGQFANAACNLIANNGAGIALVFLGLWLAHKLVQGN